jgi:hypothetical protein
MEKLLWRFVDTDEQLLEVTEEDHCIAVRIYGPGKVTSRRYVLLSPLQANRLQLALASFLHREAERG